ncbi:uncharacterized protein TOT_030000436 [Theileria orientalis strain Shintoku]|uniref:leucine--tRNA ligase n=1 Tax=Theileria orientalis strain Shintoku TaxID=869250 RepID=J4C8Q0_THEOR|nr:uncharacterized protein TOT_030000436 [Theileria orientalis strain Shintoku]BAM41173.1 uncharacterized protein TOT_030000436 [Theileria orientalis strain Shintoku]|eukprot:XP_009691474.1 uncharacterized protein TOT_030000436 [Theileria orientalis strain Shintoku]
MILVYVRGAILIYTWILLFKCGILVSTSIRSKKSLKIFSSELVNSNSFDLLRQCRRNLSFLHTYRAYREDFESKKLIDTKRPVKLRLLQEIEENYQDFEYNFPRYETKWQKFWDETNLFSTEEIDVSIHEVEESQPCEAKQGRFKHKSVVYRDWNPDGRINDDSLTHFQNFDGIDYRTSNEDEKVCDYASLSSGSRYSSQFLSGNHGRAHDDSITNHIVAKDDKEDLNDIEGQENRQKYYILAMIPYPSGKGLHVGHLLGYTAVDVVARYKRLNNYHVLNPMGFDCFGIPTEIYSESVNKTPQEVTSENVRNFRKQLKSMGFSFDFSREVLTSDVDYYRWTQWIFQNMFLKGLAYVDKGYVNYCPGLRSELSNEEIKHGKSVRGDHDVYKRLRTMWKLKITDYARRLYDDLSSVDYPEKLKNLQKKWIGPKQGYLIRLLVEEGGGLVPKASSGEGPRCLYGFVDDVSKCVDMESVEVPVLLENVLDYCSRDKEEEVRALLEESLKMSNVDLADESNRRRIYSGMSALNPYNSSKVPIYVTNSLINTNRDINCKINVEDSKGRGEDAGVSEAEKDLKEADWCKPYLHFNIKDWEFSRNRGWGEPIPSGADMDFKRQMLEKLPLVLNEKIKETMPQWAGSSWHYLRFVDPYNQNEIFSRRKASYWLPVDLYIGGVEHAVSHLLYSRFWNKFLYDIKVSPVSEPFKKIILHGVIKTVRFYVDRENAVCGESSGYYGEVVEEEQVEVPPGMVMKYKNKYVLKGDRSVEVKVRMKKMSKSRGNVINPEEIIKRYGSDTLRLHLLFLGPIEKDKVWSTESINGVYRLLRSIHSFYTECLRENGYGKISANMSVRPDGEVANALSGGEGVPEHRFDDDSAADSTSKQTNAMYSSGGVRTSNEAAVDSMVDREVALEVNRFIDNVTRDIEHVKLNKISEFFSFLKRMQKWRQEGRLRSRVLDTFLVMLSPFAPHLAEELWHRKHLNSASPNAESTLCSEGNLSEGGSVSMGKNYRSIALERWPEKINVL